MRNGSPNDCPTCGSIHTHQKVTPYGFVRECRTCGFVYRQR
jgi:predicted RNA-binding Zn-ribbon protein involved in translation (DUF1610 family)